MNLTTLMYFMTVVEKGSIGAAADELHVSRQALSGDMVRMEEELDCHLLLRSKNGVQATESGKLLYHRLTEMKEQWEKTQEEMRVIRARQRTQLSLLVSNSIFYTFPAEAFISFEERNPSISLNMNTLVMEECLKSVENGETDAAILPFAFQSRQVKSTLVAQERRYLLVNRKNPLSRRAAMTAEDLVNQVMLVRSAPDVVKRALNLTTIPQGCTLKHVPNSLDFIREGVVMNQGVCVVSGKMADTRENENLCLVPCKGELEYVNVYLLENKKCQHRVPVEKLRRFLMAYSK